MVDSLNRILKSIRDARLASKHRSQTFVSEPARSRLLPEQQDAHTEY